MLDETIEHLGSGRVAAFVAEPIGGATTGASVPPDDYWPAVAEVCRRHGVLLVADEVMTGFGRTGAWFACDHWGVQPDVLVAGKGASSGYWPLGLAIASGTVHDTVRAGGGFVHGFTWSHHPAGAAVGLAVLTRIVEDGLVERSRVLGARLLDELRAALADVAIVGDVRGKGLLVGIELVADRDTKEPFPRAAGVVEQVTRVAKDLGLLVYPSTGCANGVDGDLFLIGPPLVITDDQLATIVTRTHTAARPRLALESDSMGPRLSGGGRRPWVRRISVRRSSGMARASWPAWPTTVSAATRLLITASSVASTAAAKNGFSASSASWSRRTTSEPPARGRRVPVLNATKISPLPWCATEPVRARPSPARRASRSSWCDDIGASVASTTMQLPAGSSRANCQPPAANSRPTGTPSTVRSAPDAEVGQHERTEPVADEVTCRDADPIPPLNPRQHIPVPAPTAPSTTGPRVGTARRRDGARRRQPPPPAPNDRRSATSRRTPRPSG